MHVVVDDSGDSGLKLSQGSSLYLVMAACIFTSEEAINQTVAAVEACRDALGFGPRWEFKYSKTPKTIRDRFFVAIKDCDFAVRAIIVDKALLSQADLLTIPEGIANAAALASVEARAPYGDYSSGDPW